MDSFLKQQVKSLVNNKPWLYCDSTWLAELDTVFDDDGFPETYIDSNGQTQTVKARTTPSHAVNNVALQDDLDAWQEKEDDGSCTQNKIPSREEDQMLIMSSNAGSVYPYWASDFNQVYEEDKGHEFLGDPPSFCNGHATTAGDEDAEGRYFDFDNGVSTVTICPIVFNGPYTFSSLTDAMASNDITVLGKRLESIVPRTVVLFHEMFHLVDNANAKDVACKESHPYPCNAVAGNADDRVRRWGQGLPESPPRWKEGLVQPGPSGLFRHVLLPLDQGCRDQVRLEHWRSKRDHNPLSRCDEALDASGGDAAEEVGRRKVDRVCFPCVAFAKRCGFSCGILFSLEP